MAIVLRDSDPLSDSGIEPDFMACLCVEALRTSVVNSEGVRSATESRWRGPAALAEEDCRNCKPMLRRALAAFRDNSIMKTS